MYEDKTYEAIRSGILDKITSLDKREGSFVSDMISPVSLEMEGIYKQFEKLLGIMFVEDSAGEYIDKRAEEYGLTRKQGTKATGSVLFTGRAGVSVPAGTLVSTITGLLFETVEEVSIPSAETTAEAAIQASEAGSVYNVLKGEVCRLPVSVSGISGVTNTEKTLGGSDDETDRELIERLLFLLRSPATSGNIYHYKIWATAVDGVGDAKIFPLDNGPGTVTVLPITSDGRSPDKKIIDDVTAYIEENRPIGATVTVSAPSEVMIQISATIVLDGGVSLADVTAQYKAATEKYIKDSVFKLNVVDYYKCLSIAYEIPGVSQVVSFTVNGGTENITIGAKEIQVLGTVTLTEAV